MAIFILLKFLALVFVANSKFQLLITVETSQIMQTLKMYVAWKVSIIRSFSAQYFPAIGLNKEISSVYLRI